MVSFNGQDHTGNPFLMVLFGATGDLSKRKLYPALFSLFKAGKLNHPFHVVGIGRTPMEHSEYVSMIQQSIATYGRESIQEGQGIEEFCNHFDYVSLDVKDPGSYRALYETVCTREKEQHLAGNRVFYLAIAPNLFGVVCDHLRQAGLTDTPGWKRLVIEKPFGHDYPSAQTLNQQIEQTFQEDEIYRIDHYLGKEMVQNIEIIRFANSMFEPLWNNRFISNIQITASETVGVEDRASYYETAGALRDMVQNHLLQMVMMVCMEPPSRLKTEAIRDEKVKVLRSLRRYAGTDVQANVIRGQYQAGAIHGKPVPGYLEERGVHPASLTETFVAARLFVDNFRWAGVPIYIRTGKRMAKKSTEIVIEFKEIPKHVYLNKNGDLGPNLLIIRINPVEGMSLLINAKKPGTDDGVLPISMEFCNNCGQETPEAYERLFFDVFEGDSTYFTRWDEVSLAWKFVDPIRHVWDASDSATLYPYSAGSWGPKEADQLLAQDGFHWWKIADDPAYTIVQAVEHRQML
jgi:glucose-6-phosphate 1-dehydrogenase